MKKLRSNATLTDVAFAVCTALEHAGEHAVLCGGSAASYYVPETYQSRDLDFVLRFAARTKVVDEALRPLGYVRTPERMYAHPAIPYTVEFPAGPLAIGSETIETTATERRGQEVLYVLLPTDVVRDRCMSYWAWADQTALSVGLAVASACAPSIDLRAIEAWTDRELNSAPAAYDRVRRNHFLDELRRALKS